jgi:hypothetical protein
MADELVPVPPFRRAFDSASNPYAARNALGITAAGGGPFQPLDGDLTALAALTGTNTIYYRSGTDTWSPVTMGANMTFAGGVLNSAAGGGGGIPEAPTDSKTYGRKNAAWVDLALSYQPLDGDLTALAALTGTSTIYYRSAIDTWSPVTIGTGLTFTAGTLDAPIFSTSAKGEVPASGGGTSNFLRADGTWAAPAGGGNVTAVGTPSNGQWAQWTGATSIQGVSTASTPWVLKAGDTMTGSLTVTPGSASGLQIDAAGTQGRIIGAGSGANVDVFFAAKGTGQHAFYTNGFTTAQVYISSINTVSDILYLGGGNGSVAAYNMWMGSGGNVKTQTPATTSNDTSVATTAFVKSLLAARSCFQAVSSANQVGFTATTYTQCVFNTANFNVGSNFSTASNGMWTPPAGKVLINAGLYFTNLTGNADSYIAIYKNGAIFRQGKFYTNTTVLGMNISFIDNASGTDYYQVYCYLGAVNVGAGGGTLNAGSLTYFDGSQI